MRTPFCAGCISNEPSGVMSRLPVLKCRPCDTVRDRETRKLLAPVLECGDSTAPESRAAVVRLFATPRVPGARRRRQPGILETSAENHCCQSHRGRDNRGNRAAIGGVPRLVAELTPLASASSSLNSASSGDCRADSSATSRSLLGGAAILSSPVKVFDIKPTLVY